MAILRFSYPGIGGSLGKCAVCGDTFLKEIVLHQSVPTIGMDGFDRDLPVHDKCKEAVLALQGPWSEIREKFPKGPLQECFDEQVLEHEKEA